MINSKQKAYLRGLANQTKAIINVGKDGVSPELTESVNEALLARELVKINVLNNSPEDVREVANKISERTRSTVLQTLGNKITLYKRNHQDQKIEFPEDL